MSSRIPVTNELNNILTRRLSGGVAWATNLLRVFAYLDLAIGAYYIGIFITASWLNSHDVTKVDSLLVFAAALNIGHIFLPILAITEFRSSEASFARFVAYASLVVLLADFISFVYRIVALVRCSSHDPLWTNQETCDALVAYNVLTTIGVGLWLLTDVGTFAASYFLSSYLGEKTKSPSDINDDDYQTLIVQEKRRTEMRNSKISKESVNQQIEDRFTSQRKRAELRHLHYEALVDVLVWALYFGITIWLVAQASNDALFLLLGALSIFHVTYDAFLFRGLLNYSHSFIAFMILLALVMLGADITNFALRVISLYGCGTTHSHFIMTVHDCDQNDFFAGVVVSCIPLVLFIIIDLVYIIQLIPVYVHTGEDILIAAVGGKTGNIDKEKARLAAEHRELEEANVYLQGKQAAPVSMAGNASSGYVEPISVMPASAGRRFPLEGNYAGRVLAGMKY